MAYTGTNNSTKNSSPSPTPLMGSQLPPSKPSNPSNLPLDTNYTITIPNVFNNQYIDYASVSMKFIAPLPSLQGEENWTIANYTVRSVPFPFTTWANNSSTSSNSYTIAQILPAVFNGTTIDVKVDVYQYDGITTQLATVKEWNVTEYAFK